MQIDHRGQIQLAFAGRQVGDVPGSGGYRTVRRKLSIQPVPGYRLPATGYRFPATGYRLPATGYRLPATGYRLPATGYRLPATGYRLPAEPIVNRCRGA
ncbi:MAG: hypothetical protein LBV45_04235 [Xanthomonadaceae bacterium]|nr:hypothetical protein [Xanthomonadaceae bacterium]